MQGWGCQGVLAEGAATAPRSVFLQGMPADPEPCPHLPGLVLVSRHTNPTAPGGAHCLCRGQVAECESLRCPAIYAPVCGTYANGTTKTFENICSTRCEREALVSVDEGTW